MTTIILDFIFLKKNLFLCYSKRNTFEKVSLCTNEILRLILNSCLFIYYLLVIPFYLCSNNKLLMYWD